MIKKKVTKNVVLSAAELEYLANQLKEEILILRGQVIKSGNKYAYSKNKKVLSFLKNEELKMEGAEGAEGEAGAEGEEEKPKDEEKPKADEDKPNETNDKPIEIPESLGTRSGVPSSRGNIAVRKRASLLDVDEETMIMKYCELKAKLENLEEATRKRFLNDSNKDAETDQIIDEVKDDASKKILEIDEKRKEEIDKVNDTLDNLKEEYHKKTNELEKKISLLELENENKEKLLKEKDEKIQTLISNPEAAKEISESIVAEQSNTNIANNENTNNLVSNEKVKELEDIIAKLNIDLQFKTKEADELDVDLKESRAEYKILQNRIERLNMVNNLILFIYLFLDCCRQRFRN